MELSYGGWLNSRSFLTIIFVSFSMTYKEAILYLERIKDTAIRVPVKGGFIESLFIGLSIGNK